MTLIAYLLQLHVGNVSGVLRGRMPEIVRAEAKAKAEIVCVLIYKEGATLKGNDPPKLYLGPLTLPSLDTPSLTSPCYNVWRFQEFSASGEGSSLKILYIEFSDEFFFISHFFSSLYLQDFFNLCYFPGFLGFSWWGSGVGVRVVVALEGGAVPWVVSRFPASKTSSFPHTFFSFFFGEFFNADRVDVHGVWIGFWCLMVGVVSLDWVGIVGFLWSDGIRSVPLSFEVDSSGVLFVDRGGDSVHSIDSFHEVGRDSSWEEIDEGIFVGDFAKGDMVFELGDIIS